MALKKRHELFLTPNIIINIKHKCYFIKIFIKGIVFIKNLSYLISLHQCKAWNESTRSNSDTYFVGKFLVCISKTSNSSRFSLMYVFFAKLIIFSDISVPIDKKLLNEFYNI